MPDPRLVEALRRAGEMVAVCEPMYIAGFPQGNEAVTQVMPDALIGWAEAAKLLDCWHQELYEQENDGASLGYPGLMHEGMCSSTTQCDPCKPCRATASFIKTMLGGDGA